MCPLPPASTLSNPSRLSQSTGLSSLCHSANSYWLSISHVVMHTFQWHSEFIPSFPCPTVSTSLFSCLDLYSCPADRFIRTIFLDSIYSIYSIFYICVCVCVNICYLFFSFWLTSLCIIGSRFIQLIRTDSCSFSWLKLITGIVENSMENA